MCGACWRGPAGPWVEGEREASGNLGELGREVFWPVEGASLEESTPEAIYLDQPSAVLLGQS